MKKKLYEYVKAYGPISVHKVADSLGISGLTCLKIIELLRQEHCLKLCPPVELSLNVECSCYYAITENHF